MVKKLTINNFFDRKYDKSVACIGFFDGVHKGHTKLIKKAISEAKNLGIKSSVICFEPDPINIISGKKNKHLISYKERLARFSDLGIDIIYVIKFDNDFLNLKANKFISDYLNKMNIVKLVCGFDYTFGYNAKGNPKLLIDKGKFETIVIDETKYLGKKISSTRIKEALIRGNFKLVDRLLGYNYLVDLRVINSTKIGKKWLVETILSDSSCILPGDDINFDNIVIDGNKIFIASSTKLEKGSRLYLSFDE